MIFCFSPSLRKDDASFWYNYHHSSVAPSTGDQLPDRGWATLFLIFRIILLPFVSPVIPSWIWWHVTVACAEPARTTQKLSEVPRYPARPPRILPSEPGPSWSWRWLWGELWPAGSSCDDRVSSFGWVSVWLCPLTRWRNTRILLSSVAARLRLSSASPVSVWPGLKRRERGRGAWGSVAGPLPGISVWPPSCQPWKWKRTSRSTGL